MQRTQGSELVVCSIGVQGSIIVGVVTSGQQVRVVRRKPVRLCRVLFNIKDSFAVAIAKVR